MRTQKRWHSTLILIAIFLTLYNILPTVIFYSKPLSKPISHQQGISIAKNAALRVNSLEPKAISWITSYNKLIEVSAKSISPSKDNPQLITVTYSNESDANKARKYLPRAGQLIPFLPERLSINPNDNLDPKTVTIHRNIPIRFTEESIAKTFNFIKKHDEANKPSPLYLELINDRLLQIGLSTGGASENFQYLQAILNSSNTNRTSEYLEIIIQNIISYSQTFGTDSPIAKRYYATFTQGNIENKKTLISQLISHLDQYYKTLKLERISIESRANDQKNNGEFLQEREQERLELLKIKEPNTLASLNILRAHTEYFSAGPNPWTTQELKNVILSKETSNNFPIAIKAINPLIQNIVLNLEKSTIQFELYQDIINYENHLATNNLNKHDLVNRLIYNEIARISQSSEETLTASGSSFTTQLNNLSDSSSLIVINLNEIAHIQSKQLIHLLKNQWAPTHTDLIPTAFPIYDQQTYDQLSNPPRTCLIVYTPTEPAPKGFHNNSMYIVAKGLQNVLSKLQNNPDSPQAKQFANDFRQLNDLLKNQGFVSYPGNTYPLNATFEKDIIFEAPDFYQFIIKATRENFKVHGTQKYASLEMSTVGQRISAVNAIEDKEHEDLLKWRDEYQFSQVQDNPNTRYDIPSPNKNVLLNNFLLSAKKYFRGDRRKILNWGLDLTGGKTVQIQLQTHNGKVITNDADITQSINELHQRVNKMGVSEVSIRQEGNTIGLSFPNAQGLSATDLVKASSMSFHVVNEKFSGANSDLRTTVQEFLQGVWNEAVVTNRKDADSINQIAWKHLYGQMTDLDAISPAPMNSSAQILFDQGLQLAHPHTTEASSQFNDSLSKISLYKGTNFSDWHGQTHPLVIVMNNYALQGSSLTNIHASYDPSKGNFLSFNVKNSQLLSNGETLTPRNDLYHWTFPFSKEKIQGTSLSKYSNGEGWRMAVILNQVIINAPTISSPLKDSVSISGNFSQREANRLEADLKAGALTFTPHILSEKNVSAELGLKDRIMGISATITALILVIIVMIGYYRFAGIIASIAVVFNLLIIWATLQNLAATLTLSGIAGIILTVGMAVDANVLVFERIREELAKTQKLSNAIHLGYTKAFSAIFDSNITTIIAALILLHFDSGPIKGFAVTLIIGIASSMFTALFFTRYIFSKWVKNRPNATLSMSNLIKKGSFNFLKYGKISIYSALAIAAIGSYLLVAQKSSIFGMDFTGGYTFTVDIDTNQSQSHARSYQEQVMHALVESGASEQEVQVHTLSPSNTLKILLAKSLDEPDHAFHNMPIETPEKNSVFNYENNPRLKWAINSLKTHGLIVSSQSLKDIDQSWNSVSGKMSDSMRNNALLGLSIALLCILAYITIRFEFKYAITATIGLAIDVAFTIAVLGIMHALGVPIYIDLNTIAALMTIIGYSLNDTIIIFDRIREDLHDKRKYQLSDVINAALNTTLSRTLMTSSTTLIVLLALLFLGGNAIFGLSLVMVIGVVFGTFSSLFIAAPMLMFFNKEKNTKKNNLTLNKN